MPDAASPEPTTAYERTVSAEVAVDVPAATVRRLLGDLSRLPDWLALHAGWRGVPPAGAAVGLTFGQSMQLVVLPQAFRAVVPPLASVLIALAKNTSVAAAFGLMEATARMRYFTNNNADDRTLIFITFAIGYIIIVELMSAGAIGLERRWRIAR